jgi:hypothetical protein
VREQPVHPPGDRLVGVFGRHFALEQRPLDHEPVPIREQLGVAVPAEDDPGDDDEAEDQPGETAGHDPPRPLPAEVGQEQQRRELAGDRQPEDQPGGGVAAPAVQFQAPRDQKEDEDVHVVMRQVAGQGRQGEQHGGGLDGVGRRPGRRGAGLAQQAEHPHRGNDGHQHLGVKPAHRPDERRQFGERPQDDRHHRRVRVLVPAGVDVRSAEHLADHRPPAEEGRTGLLPAVRRLGDLDGVLQTGDEQNDGEQAEDDDPEAGGVGRPGGTKPKPRPKSLGESPHESL